MLVEIGQFSLILAFLVSVVQGIVPFAGAQVKNRALMETAQPAALLQLGLIALSCAIFVHAFIVSDFSVLNVYQNSSLNQPLIYKITATWGSHAGSMLLWALMLALYGGGVAAFGRALPLSLRARTLAIQGLVCCGTLAFVLFTSNPFARMIPAPPNGRALNPLLQDPGIALHPPLLYFGYVGFSITYSFAVAGLLEGRITASWARWMRPWLLLAWCSLTLGIAAGSHWAYYVLGWGGWWHWDPVENASFMPWLLATALLHSAAVVEKREALQRWTVLLGILTFGMSLVGTFLVRSGILTSVHAFALDPSRGVFILALVMVVVGGALLLYAVRAPAIAPGTPFAPISREGALVLNNVLLAAGMTTVFLGTFYPLFAQVWSGVKLSVGPPYFDKTFLPIMAPAIIAMVCAPMLAWRRGDLLGTLRRLLPALLGAIIVPLAVLAYMGSAPPAALGGIALATWAMLGVLIDLADRVGLMRTSPAAAWRRLCRLPRSSYGCALGHFGVGVLIAGIAVTTAWRSQRIVMIHPGQSLTIAGRTLLFKGVSDRAVENFREQRATVVVEEGGVPVETLHPERRYYPVAGSATTHTAIASNGLADLYLALGGPDGHGGWVLRAFFNPLVPWIWFGAAISALGGLVSLSDRRLRLRVPAAARPARGTPDRGAGAIARHPSTPRDLSRGDPTAEPG
jgi:cytochrome c-type biogenesis protein CcmF